LPHKKIMRSRNQVRDSILVIDLEATCWRGNPPEGMYNEIIEFGIATVDFKTKKILETDSIIVKPRFSEISAFCTELTTLTQSFIDEHGISFEEACEKLRTKYKSEKRIWASWGKYDLNQIEKDCALHKVKFPMGRDHYNLKPLFSFKHGLGTDLGVDTALKHLGLEFEGTHHRGGDDAKNIARILKTMF
jgi:inhibitor of KinA sporulation pathway (predicted exonuclease)